MEGQNGSDPVSFSKRWEDISARAIERLRLNPVQDSERHSPFAQQEAASNSVEGSEGHSNNDDAGLSASPSQSVQQLVRHFNVQNQAVASTSLPTAADLESQLDLLGITAEQLSDTGRQHLHAIAGVAEKLGLVSAKPAAILAAVARMRQAQWSAEDSQAAAAALGSRLRDEIALVRCHSEELSSVSENMKQQTEAAQPGLEAKQERMLRMQNKTAQYAAELEQLDAKLRRGCFVPELQHSRLMERATNLAAKQAQISELQLKLAYFRDLPPDTEAAQQVYAQKYEQMQAATKQFEDGLAQL